MTLTLSQVYILSPCPVARVNASQLVHELCLRLNPVISKLDSKIDCEETRILKKEIETLHSAVLHFTYQDQTVALPNNIISLESPEPLSIPLNPSVEEIYDPPLAAYNLQPDSGTLSATSKEFRDCFLRNSAASSQAKGGNKGIEIQESWESQDWPGICGMQDTEELQHTGEAQLIDEPSVTQEPSGDAHVASELQQDTQDILTQVIQVFTPREANETEVAVKTQRVQDIDKMKNLPLSDKRRDPEPLDHLAEGQQGSLPIPESTNQVSLLTQDKETFTRDSSTEGDNSVAPITKGKGSRKRPGPPLTSRTRVSSNDPHGSLSKRRKVTDSGDYESCVDSKQIIADPKDILQISRKEWETLDAENNNSLAISDSCSSSLKTIVVFDKVISGLSRRRITNQGLGSLMTAMILAVGNRHALENIGKVSRFVVKHQYRRLFGVYSPDPKVLFRSVDILQTSNDLNCYLRRVALARIAQVFDQTCLNHGKFSQDFDPANKDHVITKMDKAEAYKSIIETVWGIPFPKLAKGTRMDRNGLIDANDCSAMSWNTYKRRLLRLIGIGQRWYALAERFGWACLALIRRDWLAVKGAPSVSDST